ncbi:MAG TPA: ribonucleoside-diphosphate reductase subunit alpha [Limnochordia bacterium]
MPSSAAPVLSPAVPSLQHMIERACRSLSASADTLCAIATAQLYPGATAAEQLKAAILAARSCIEVDPDYSRVAARLLLSQIYREVLGADVAPGEIPAGYRDGFRRGIERGVALGLLSPDLLRFDLDRLSAALEPERDLEFRYLGLQTLYDRYLLQYEGERLETPQAFWMRVAMGLSLNEADKERWAIAFYRLHARWLFCASTPTLFNAGTRHPQLSSCFLTTIPDDLGDIFKAIRDNALLSKWAGGIGNDWTPVRALGAPIRGTNGKSQGVIPFMKVANDTAIAVNQGGKRQGAVCAYLETWHHDLLDFLELRRNTGDERRRTHDMHTAHWIPDLFMRRVAEDGPWTLFSPDEVGDLHELYGEAFDRRYEEYERMADAGRIRVWTRLPARELWRKMLAALYETGHPWLTFKDPSNIRNPQDHVGVIHSSNLCTEILLNTSPDETAVCNLGSVNLAAHVRDGKLDLDLLEQTVKTAVRALDNVIDINFYPTPEAERSNRRHRPIGLGMMGFQDALSALGLSYASEEAVAFADASMEAIAYFAIEASVRLAAERGPYPTFSGSKWDRGLLPLDTARLLAQARGAESEIDLSARLDWDALREQIKRYGMRNSHVTAIAPTATIANIVGTSPSIEPTYSHLYVKSNIGGEFTIVNEFLVRDLKRLGLWDEAMLEALKYYDGSLAAIDRIPAEMKARYPTAFEIDPAWLIECAARRQKWIDMGQSLNLYLAEPSGRKLSAMYELAWKKGLKTTYYLRTRAATQIEKSTVDVNRFGIQPRWMKSESPSAAVRIERGQSAAAAPKTACAITESDCEVCQ